MLKVLNRCSLNLTLLLIAIPLLCSDIIIGAPHADMLSRNDSGSVYLYMSKHEMGTFAYYPLENLNGTDGYDHLWLPRLLYECTKTSTSTHACFH